MPNKTSQLSSRKVEVKAEEPTKLTSWKKCLKKIKSEVGEDLFENRLDQIKLAVGATYYSCNRDYEKAYQAGLLAARA